MKKQSGGAILVALIVILTGAILLSMWMKTRPSYTEAYHYFKSYQGRIIAEAFLTQGSSSDVSHQNVVPKFLDSMEYQVKSNYSAFFYDEVNIRVYLKGRRLGELSSSSLEPLSSSYKDVRLRLWTSEELQGDHRQIQGEVQTHSQEDIEAGLSSSTVSINELKLIESRLETQWKTLTSGTLLTRTSEVELIEGPRLIQDTLIITSSKIILDDSVQMKNVDLITLGGLELSNSSSFQGRVLSRDRVELSLGSHFEGWLGVLQNQDSTALPQLKLWDASFKGWVFSFGGGIAEDDLASVEMDESSEMKGVIITPHKVFLQNDMIGHLSAYSLECSNGPNCVGPLGVSELLSKKWTQPTWLGTHGDTQIWNQQRWTR